MSPGANRRETPAEAHLLTEEQGDGKMGRSQRSPQGFVSGGKCRRGRSTCLRSYARMADARDRRREIVTVGPERVVLGASRAIRSTPYIWQGGRV